MTIAHIGESGSDRGLIDPRVVGDESQARIWRSSWCRLPGPLDFHVVDESRDLEKHDFYLEASCVQFLLKLGPDFN